MPAALSARRYGGSMVSRKRGSASRLRRMPNNRYLAPRFDEDHKPFFMCKRCLLTNINLFRTYSTDAAFNVLFQRTV